MAKSLNTIYLLWGAQFDELAATMFITQLRKMGLRIKVVALSPSPIIGVFGQAISADLNLHQALNTKARAAGLIIPGSVKKLQRLQNDPRLTHLLQMMAEKDVPIFISQQEEGKLQKLPFAARNIFLYPNERELITFIEQTSPIFKSEQAHPSPEN